MLTDEEKSKIKAYLGYPQVDSAVLASLSTIRYNYRIDNALNKLSVEGEARAREYLVKLDAATSTLDDALSTLVVNGVGSIRMRSNPGQKVRQEIRYWTKKLSDLLDVPILKGSAIDNSGVNAEVLP